MTTATNPNTVAGRRIRFWHPEFWSAANMVRVMDQLVDAVLVFWGGLMRNFGIAALVVGDTFVSGYVLSQTLSKEPLRWVTVVAFCMSFATTALTVTFLEMAFSGGLRRVKLLPLLFAVAVIPIDALIDVKFVPLLQYGVEATRTTLLAPAGADVMCGLEMTLLGLATTFGELGVAFLRRRRSVRAGTMLDEHLDDAVEVTAR